MSTKRLAFLEQLVSSGTKDPMPHYGLAQEYRSLGRIDDAERAFLTLRALDASYVPQYLMAGQMFESAGRPEDARAWYEAGIEAAQASRNAHALGELQSALATLLDA